MITKLKKLYPDEILRLRIEFDNDMKLSVNKIWSWWAGTQWIRKKAADLWHSDIFYFLEEEKIQKIHEKVNVFFEFSFSTWDNWGSRQLDSSNTAMMAKMVEDALKYDKKKNPKWIIADDTNSQVGWVALHSIELPLKARKELETSYVDVSIRKFKPEL